MEKKKLIIIGASGHGKVVADIALQIGNWHEILFLDDYSRDAKLLNFPIVGSMNNHMIMKYKNSADFIVAVGDNKNRKKIFCKLKEYDVSIATLVHPKAIVGLDVQISEGTVIAAGSVISTSSTIGKGVIINTSTTVDHDCRIGDFVHLSPGVNIAGSVLIGANTWIGIGSSIINNLNISGDSIIGAGSVVIRDILIKGRYKGIPAKKI